jgi:hypothetical protein
MALYNDRVYAYERMPVTAKAIEKHPTAANMAALLHDEERNILAFKELEHYNAHGSFLYVHELTLKHKQYNKLERLRRADPEGFGKELINADKSITRYKSMIKNRKYKDRAERVAWEQHIIKFEEKKEIMARLLAM